MRTRSALGRAALLLVLCAAVSAQQLAEDECIAAAFAESDPTNAVGEAISNAVANAFSKSVACGNEQGEQNPNSVSSLAVSIAVAISSSQTVGTECVAEADAFADVVSGLVTEELANGLVENADEGTEQILAEAWLGSEASKIEEKVRNDTLETTVGKADDLPPGCIDLSVLSGSLATAVELGEVIQDAVNLILQAVTCGDNVIQSSALVTGGVTGKAPSGCFFDSTARVFVGSACIAPVKQVPTVEAAPEEETETCSEQFRRCQATRKSIATCLRNLDSCQKGVLEATQRPQLEEVLVPETGSSFDETIQKLRQTLGGLFRG